MTSRSQVQIPEATVARLPIYHRTLEDLRDAAVPTVSSDRLAELSGVNAAKVRKDFSYIGSYGTRGVGYEVDNLLHQIERVLGLTSSSPVVIVGLGNLGRALSRYAGLAEGGFPVVALVDADPDKIGRTVNGIEVSAFDDLESVVRSRSIEVGIITTPPEVAQAVADELVGAGIRSILNFAPTVITVPDSVPLRKVDLATELQILGFYQSARV